MSGRRKFHVYGSDEESPVQKVAKTDADVEGGVSICNRKVSVRVFKGKVYVDIREYYKKDGKEMPGKKGISLSLDQWEVLRDHIDAIDQAIEEDD